MLKEERHNTFLDQVIASSGPIDDLFWIAWNGVHRICLGVNVKETPSGQKIACSKSRLKKLEATLWEITG